MNIAPYAGERSDIDTELITIIGKDIPAQCYAAPWGLGIWEYGSESVMIAPAYFPAEDQRKLEMMAEIFVDAREDAGEDNTETMCLFEPEEGQE